MTERLCIDFSTIFENPMVSDEPRHDLKDFIDRWRVEHPEGEIILYVNGSISAMLREYRVSVIHEWLEKYNLPAMTFSQEPPEFVYRFTLPLKGML